MDLSGLSSILWRERDILEHLLFKLDVQQLLLMSGRAAWLVRASAEIETALEQVRLVELERAVRFERLAGELGLGSAPSLTKIAEVAEEPWKSLLTEHYEAFIELATRIQSITSLNRELASAAQQTAAAVISSIQGDLEPALQLYEPSGATARVERRAVFVDEGL
jgi:hypothetical protein